MNRSIVGILVVAGWSFASLASAALVPGDFSPGAPRINFDSLAGSPSLGGGELLTNQYASLGVTFVNPSYGSYANTSLAGSMTINTDPNAIWVEQGSGSSGLVPPLEVHFAPPVGKVGANVFTSFAASFTMRLFNASNVELASLTTVLPNPAGDGREGFVGLSGPAITKVTMQSNATGGGASFNFTFDDLVFEVPEPASLGGMTLAIAVPLAVNRARRRRFP
jgi:hypothetical protein